MHTPGKITILGIARCRESLMLNHRSNLDFLIWAHSENDFLEKSAYLKDARPATTYLLDK